MIHIEKKIYNPYYFSITVSRCQFQNDFWNSKTDRDIHNLFKELNTIMSTRLTGDLMDNAIKGMLAGLDPYTVYLSKTW
jgi:carboxyl-terminal processing protease